MSDDDDDFVDPGEIGSFRRDGSDTMKDGAEAIAPQLGMLRGRVMYLLENLGPMTDRELVGEYAIAYGPCEYRSIGTRRRELVDKGFVRNTGRTKMNLKTNVPNIIWMAIPKNLRTSSQWAKERLKIITCPHCGKLVEVKK